jgi:hypothetical protein
MSPRRASTPGLTDWPSVAMWLRLRRRRGGEWIIYNMYTYIPYFNVTSSGIRCSKGTPIINKSNPSLFIKGGTTKEGKKQKSWHWTNKYTTMGPSGARCQEWPCWLFAISKLLLCSALQEAWSNTSTVALLVIGDDAKWSLESETVKCGRESLETRTREWLRWRGSAAIVNDRPVLSSERALHINKLAIVWQ